MRDFRQPMSSFTRRHVGEETGAFGIRLGGLADAQDEGGVNGEKDTQAVITRDRFAAHLRDRDGSAEQRLGGGSTHGDHQVGLMKPNS